MRSYQRAETAIQKTNINQIRVEAEKREEGEPSPASPSINVDIYLSILRSPPAALRLKVAIIERFWTLG